MRLTIRATIRAYGAQAGNRCHNPESALFASRGQLAVDAVTVTRSPNSENYYWVSTNCLKTGRAKRCGVLSGIVLQLITNCPVPRANCRQGLAAAG